MVHLVFCFKPKTSLLGSKAGHCNQTQMEVLEPRCSRQALRCYDNRIHNILSATVLFQSVPPSKITMAEKSNDPAKPSGKHPGDRLASYFENFFRGVIGIATFGASITFSKIVEAPTTPFHHYGFTTHQIQYLIASAWLLFILTLAFTSFFAGALSLYRPQAVQAFGETYGETRVKVLWYAIAVSAILFTLVIASFISLSLVVVAYVGAVGWIALFFTLFFALLGYAAMIWQSPLKWPQLRFEREGQTTFEEHLGLRDEHGGLHQRMESIPVPKIRFREPQPAHEEGAGYGRSTSGDYAQGGGRRVSRKEEGYDRDRYSRASTVISDAYEPGRFGQDGYIYDDGVREGVVMSAYR